MTRTVYILISFLVLGTSISLYSQKPFELKRSFYFRGDIAIAGNTIVGKHSKKVPKSNNLINDGTDMRYIDVDDDKSTFSSSSAYMSIPENAKIKSALLYWSAIYSCNKSRKVIKGNRILYECDDQRDQDFNQVLLKTPDLPYQPVTGSVVFDGIKQERFKDSAPYVCMADITSMISEQGIKEGWYTLANVKATQGFISGGSSAGWFLIITYEDELESAKFITLYDGLLYLEPRKDYDLKLGGFKTALEGPVNSSLMFSALEGDKTISRDQVFIRNANDTLKALRSKYRPQRNFFYSSITTKNKIRQGGKPFLPNTLGFDLIELDVENTDNTTIGNDQDEITLKFQTKGDRYHLFFTAFKTEIDTSFYERKVKNQVEVVKLDITAKNDFEDEAETIVGLQNSSNTNKSKNSAKTTNDNSNSKRVMSDDDYIVQKLNIAGLEPGFYIVTNVFSKTNLATRWEKVMTAKEFSTYTFINPANKWHYVSVYNSKNRKEAISRVKEIRKDPELTKSWVFRIN